MRARAGFRAEREIPLKARVLTVGLVVALAVVVSVLALLAHRVMGPASAPASASPRAVPPGGSGAASSSAPPSPAGLPPPSARRARHCARAPHACGFPDATNSGVPAGTKLRAVPGRVSSGKGWSYDPATQTVNVTGNGARLTGLAIAGNLNITASHVTVRDDRVVADGIYGISLRHTSDVTIARTTVRGRNATTGRVNYAIDDIYGDSTRLVISRDNIAYWRIGVNAVSGRITGNYIHDPGFVRSDHTDGIYDAGGTSAQTISGNTILNDIGQTCAIMLQSVKGQRTGNKTISGNLLAGGDYVIYAGGAHGGSSHIVITHNRFGEAYFPAGGRYGPAAQFQVTGAGNTWSGNVWMGDAQPGARRGHPAGSTVPLP
jgi:hypothetical protein